MLCGILISGFSLRMALTISAMVAITGVAPNIKNFVKRRHVPYKFY